MEVAWCHWCTIFRRMVNNKRKQNKYWNWIASPLFVNINGFVSSDSCSGSSCMSDIFVLPIELCDACVSVLNTYTLSLTHILVCSFANVCMCVCARCGALKYFSIANGKFLPKAAACVYWNQYGEAPTLIDPIGNLTVQPHSNGTQLKCYTGWIPMNESV